MKFFQNVIFAVLGILTPALAQNPSAWDASGNGLLSGRYYFREVAYVPADLQGNLSRAVAAYGVIDFDGAGAYSVTGFLVDSSSATAQPRPYSIRAQYVIASSGFGTVRSSLSGIDSVFGLIADGIFIGSSTEGDFNNLFVAVRAAELPATEARLTGAYSFTSFDFPDRRASGARNALFHLTADGSGGILSALELTGYIAARGATPVAQTIAASRYAFEDGIGKLLLPGSSSSDALVSGDKILYASADGAFVIGGAANGWDILVGIRSAAPQSVSLLQGLYFQVGVDRGSAATTSFYGSFHAASGKTIGHQRVSQPAEGSVYDYSYTGVYAANGGALEDGPQTERYLVGDGGRARITFSKWPALGFSVALRTPSFSGPGVFLNPTGVVNAASSAPFTAGIARGSLITLYGSNLAGVTQVASSLPLPRSLGGVVLINGLAAAVYAVSPTQLSVIVPYGVRPPVAKIQVVNNGTASNSVTTYLNLTAPGVFTIPPGGIGQAAALHSDNSLVTAENPARTGEVIAVYLSGLGDVAVPVADGAPGPLNTGSVATHAVGVSVGGRPALLWYAGLAPGLVGLYQLNVQIPEGIPAGDARLDVYGPDSYSSGAVLPMAAR